MKHIIDANGKKLGRIASEIACLLMGKHTASFARNIVSSEKIEVINTSQLFLSQKKIKNTYHTRYTGYPGGLRKESIEKVLQKKGHGELVRRAVYGMLPANKLRTKRMKNLVIK